MSTCVVKDIEFMNTSKRLGVHPDNLELIVHEFINKEGNEGSFPTDSYIKEALSGKPFEASRGAIKLWKRRYSTPKTFRNLAELQRAVSEAEKFFPREAIGTYRTNDNKYVMQVGTPLLKNPTQSRVDQIVTHLRLSGIPVHGRRGMIRYIRENGLDNVQQGANRLYQMFIGKKARANFEKTLRNQRPDMSNEEIKSTLDFLHSLEDNKENTAYIKAAIKWVANRSITLPQDNTKAKQVFSEARKRHIDVMKYNTLGELIASDEMKPKEKEKPKFDPDKAKTFSNKRTVTTEKGRVFTVYDVENNWEGQREVCKALAAHYKVSPWCLSTFTATGEPTQSAKKFWNRYNGVKRRIAYEDGKPVAFSSDEDTAEHQGEISDYVDDILNRLLKDQLSEQEQVDLEKAIDELASSNESGITNTPEYVKEFIDKNPELYKEFEKEWSHVYTINGKENEILKKLLLEYSESVSNFRDGYKDEAFTLGDNGEFGFTWALCLELPETSLANKIKGENGLSDREAWWDMEDTHSTPELGDFIMNERMLSEKRDRERNPGATDDIGRNPGLALAEARHQYEEMGIPEHFIDAIEHTGEDEVILGIYRDHPEFTTEDQVAAEFNRRMDNYINQQIGMDLPWFKTPSGEIYGFVTPEGEMYLDTRVINEEHPIHEYTHLWDKAVQDRNPGLWLRGAALMKQIPLWNEIANSNQYGAKWRESGITEDKLTNLIASEVHARLVGKEGAEIIRNLAKEKGNKGIVAKLKQWLLDFWKELKSTFGTWDNKELSNLTLEQFNMMTVRDFARGVPLNDITLSNGLTYTQSLNIQREMEAIRQQAIADGTFMKAPNGKPTNLNKRQWLQVRTKAFKEWFGDWEKVVPKNIKGNLINQNGEINWDYFEQILDSYHNSQPDSMFAKGRTTLATREEKHFEGEKNTLNHIKFVTQSMLDLFEGKFDADLPFVSEARASLQNQKDLMVLAAMFHDAAKPYRHGDIHGWESADILRDIVGIDYNNRLAEWAIRHHMAMPFSHKTEFNLSNPEALEVARNMARDAKRIGIDEQTAINAFVLINAADIINGREITVEDNWAKKAKASGSTKFGDDISVKAVLTVELKEKVDLLKKAFADIKDEDLGNPEYNYRNQSRFDYISYPEGGRADGKLPYLSNITNNDVSKVVDENGEPLVVYHGTNVENISIFDRTKIPEEQTLVGTGTATFGNFFSDKQDDAKSFAAAIRLRRKSGKATVYDAFLNIKNPMYFETLGDFRNYSSKKGHYNENGDFVSDVKLPEEYDGVIVKRRNNSDDSKEFVAPSSNQIKSATDNVGTFSRTDNNIQMYIENGENENIASISNKTEAYGVEISSGSKEFWNKIREGWQSKHPQGLVAYRKHGDSPKTFSAETVKEGWIGNPFSTQTRGESTVQQFYDWLVTGNNFGNERATEEFRQAIIQKILNTPASSPILYYTELNRPSHATVIGYLVNNKQLLQSPKGDFAEGINPNTINQFNQQNQQSVQLNEMTGENQSNIIRTGENANLQNAYVEHQKKVEAQVNNLLDMEGMSATELRDVADQVAWLISDHITDLQTKEGYLEETYKEMKKEDIAGLSRADIVRKIGPQRIMDWCRDIWFDTKNNKYDFDLDDVLLLNEIRKNWEGLMLLAQNTLLTIEKFSITTNPTTAELEVNTDLTANPDDFNSPQDTASIEEIEGSQQAHWQVETYTEDVISLMSQQVKLALMRCLRLDADGNPIKSRLGVNERINLREATNFILRNTQGALTLDAMVAKLSDKVKDNPWISQLVQRLSDKSGKETDFQSQFVSDFIRPFQSYSVVRLVTDETGKSHYESVMVNEDPALSDAMKQITTQYKINEHPMFTSEGINKSTFEDLKTQIDSLEKFSHTGYNVEDPALKEEAAKTLGYISNLFGYYVTPDMVAANLDAKQFETMYSSLLYMRDSLEKNLNNRTYDPFNFKNKDSINGNLRNFLKPITMYFDDVAVASLYDSGKMYQSYTLPSYMSKLMAKLSETDPTKFREFMHEEFGKYDWFRDQSQLDKTRGWRNNLIESLSRDPVTREKFKRKVQLNFNKHNYMKNMDDMEYTLSLITEFLAEYNPTGKRQWSWYRVPMQSNKPSSDFIRMERYNDANYQESIAENMQRIFSQELSRIQSVRLRNFSKEDLRYIKNLDKNGRKFCFLDFMNDYLEGSMKNSELGRLINDKLDGKKVNLGRLYTLSKNVILQKMTIRANEIVQNWENQGILDAAKKISNAGLTKDEIRENLINFVWNDTLAAMNIMELTITDIAYYKDAEDLQKRLAQIHAPGIRGNVTATDYKGNPVSDGKERTIYLTDFDNFVSNIVDNVSVVFDRKIDAARRRGATGEVKGLEALKDSLVRPRTYKEDGSIDDEGGEFWNINVADAQAYNSPTSYRKKAFIFGKWSRQAESIYQKLRKGEYNYSDLKTAFQPLKPFVYSQIEKSIGVDGAPMRNLKMGVQNKNSEYLLIMADAMLQGENTGKPNLLRAIYNVMESSHYDEVTGEYKRDGIDTVQFVSAVKVGETGAISLNEYLNDENGEAIAENVLKAHIYNTTTTINPETGEAVERREYNNNVVQAIPFEDYCLQQEVPQHFREHGDGQLHGSQLRYIVPSELADYNDAGEAVTYEVEGRKLSAKAFKAEYEQTIAANIEDSINELADMLDLNVTNENGEIDMVRRNTILSLLLQKEILSSPRYGFDLFQACSVENGRFRIPLGDPIQSKRVEQLINSIIKNHVNKQNIAGGPAVQVSNFGTSRQLNIRFKDKNGGMLMTRDEWEKSTSSSKGNSFKEYIRQNQGGIAYFEVLAPIYANELFEKFADKNGVINIEAIEMVSPELLKMIGYRIPTEAKYSMAPLKIVGFLPREAGDGIMLPYDITRLTGSDFDVDKEYLMRKDYKINITKISKRDMASLLYNELIDSQKKRGKLSYELKRKVDDLVQRFLSDPFDKASLVGTKTSDDFLGMTEGAYKKLLRTYVKNRYVLEDPADIRTQRNNKIIDMTYEVLTHETSAAEMLNPGGFNPQKRMGYMVSVARATNIPWSQLQRKKTKELKNLANKDKNLMYIDTHIQFYRQNSAAGSLIGIFAVNRTAHAVIENEGYQMDVDKILDNGVIKYVDAEGNTVDVNRVKPNGDNTYYIEKAGGERVQVFRKGGEGTTFRVAGMEFAGLMPIDVRFDRSGESVGRVLGSLVASAADAVKDPVLNLMNINSNTANILTTLIRLGMPFDDAALFLSQSVISEALSTLSKQNIDGFSSLTKVVNEMIKKMEEDTGIDTSSPISKEELTRQELISGLKPGNDKVNYKVLQALSHFIKLANAMRMPTAATRFNSMSSAVGPLIVDNLMTEYKLDDLSSNSAIVDSNGDPIDIADILEAHPILQQFARTLGIAQDLFGNMPANSTGFRNLLNSVVGTQVGKALMNDRRLMSKLSDFYQSYLVVAGNVVDSSRLEEVINNFPKEFIDGNYKERYRDNKFIQAIRFDTDKSGRPTLKIDTTGLDTGQKERLSCGWIDLHRVNPKLSLKLFEYCFFRGGIGFNPKTFMNLVPVFIKERIPHYTETFEKLPFTEASIIMDQFIRHNWNEKKLVRHIDTQKDKDHPFFINTIDGKTVILANKEIATSKYKLGVGDYVVIKNFNNSDRDILCKFTQPSEDIGPNLLMQEVDPLGDNGEFVEITVEGRENSIAPATVAMEDNTPSEVTQETETDGPQQDDVEMTPEEEEELLYKIFMSHERDRDAARAEVERHRSLPEAAKEDTERAVKTYMKNRFEALGLAFNEDKINKLYERMC